MRNAIYYYQNIIVKYKHPSDINIITVYIAYVAELLAVAMENVDGH